MGNSICIVKNLLIATTNPAKLEEFKTYFSKFLPHIKLFSLSDFNFKESPQESGKTFEENALIKARFYAKLTNLPTLADDGGFEIEVLNGQPGVLSRRWPGYEASDEELINMVLEKLEPFPPSKRKARLKTVVVVVNKNGKIIAKAEESIQGIIPPKPSAKTVKGFPFRSVLWLQKFKKYYQDLDEKEHQKVNHRLKIVKKLSKLLYNPAERKYYV